MSTVSLVLAGVCVWLILAAALLMFLMRISKRRVERDNWRASQLGNTVIYHKGERLPPEVKTKSQVRERKARQN